MKYEFDVLRIVSQDPNEMKTELNKKGNEGWKVVTMTNEVYSDDSGAFMVVLQREKSD